MMRNGAVAVARWSACQSKPPTTPVVTCPKPFLDGLDTSLLGRFPFQMWDRFSSISPRCCGSRAPFNATQLLFKSTTLGRAGGLGPEHRYEEATAQGVDPRITGAVTRPMAVSNVATQLKTIDDIQGRIESIHTDVLQARLIVTCLQRSIGRNRNLTDSEYDAILSSISDPDITQFVKNFTTIADFTKEKAKDELEKAENKLEKAENKLEKAKDELKDVKAELEELSPSTLKAFLASVEWDKVFEEVDRTALGYMAGTIGYEYADGASTMYPCTNTNPCVAFASIMETNWKVRVKGIQKDQVDICATFGAAGQGKTEFCRQMSKYLLSCKYDEIDKVVPIMVSFNHTTPWSDQQESSDYQYAVIRRVLTSLSLRNIHIGTKLVNLDLTRVLSEIRSSAATHFKVEACRIGIVLFVDELMKVDVRSRKEILNNLAGIHLLHLGENIFTQFVVTSLNISPVAKEYVTESKRRVKAIVLPQLDSAARDRVFQSVSGFYRDIFLRRYAADKRHIRDNVLVQKEVLQKELDVFLRTVINICGRNFRMLESALVALYVAITQGQAPTKETHPVGVWLEAQSCERVDMAHLVLKKGTDKMRDTLSMRQLFTTLAISLMTTSPTVLNAAVCLFQNVLFDPAYTVTGAHTFTGGVTVQELINVGIVYIHGNMGKIDCFCPRVNLPYLFTECMASALKGESISGDDKTVLANFAMRASSIKLGDAIESFVVARLGVMMSIDRMREKDETFGAQDGFEYAVADLHFLRHCRRTDSCAVNDLFEGSMVEGWGDDESDANLEINAPPDYVYEIAQEECPSPGMLKSMCVRQSGKNWAGIECVVHLWKRHGVVLPLLFSNKLRGTTNGKISQKAANSAHKAAKDGGYKPGEYYVVVFTCDQDVPTKKCKGTIYVLLSGTTAMLEPVGGTCLFNVVQMKGLKPLQ